MIWAQKSKNRSRDPGHAPFKVICHPWARTCYGQPIYQIWRL